jgi:hypothetical protein
MRRILRFRQVGIKRGSFGGGRLPVEEAIACAKVSPGRVPLAREWCGSWTQRKACLRLPPVRVGSWRVRGGAVGCGGICGAPADTIFAWRKWWRRGESNPRPENVAVRRLHAYPIQLGSPSTLKTGKKRRRLARWISPLHHGPRRNDQPAVRRLISGPQTKPEETGQPVLGCQSQLWIGSFRFPLDNGQVETGMPSDSSKSRRIRFAPFVGLLIR